MYYYRRIMSNYIISKETKNIAKRLNIQICASSNPKKKIDVINRDGKKISIGDVKYGDFHTHKKISLDHANERRRLYRIRHANDINVIGSAGYYAAILLW